jgi:hypothetical protein
LFRALNRKWNPEEINETTERSAHCSDAGAFRRHGIGAAAIAYSTGHGLAEAS